MNEFFQIDGPFQRFGNLVADMILLSLLWILVSIPIITIGASTTGLFYVATKRIGNKEGYLFRDFWKSFKLNFKQATLAWLAILTAGILLYLNITQAELLGQFKNLLLPLHLVFVFELILVSIFIFPLIARFEMKFIDLLKSAFFMANRHIFTSLVCILIAAVVFIVTYVTGIFIVIAPGVYSFFASYLIMKIFKKYRPEIDNDEF